MKRIRWLFCATYGYNSLKKLKINYLFIIVISALLATMYWTLSPWINPDHSRVARIVARGELRVSTLASPLTWINNNGLQSGLDYELVQHFARYLGVRLHITVRNNISQLFDDLDKGRADLLASALVADEKRSAHYRPGPEYYSVSQQLVYRRGAVRPRSIENLNARQLTIAAGQVINHELHTLKTSVYPGLSWRVDQQHSSSELLEQVARGTLDYTIADSAAINLFQRVHPQLAVALDVTDEQPVVWFSTRDHDDSLAAAVLDFFRRLHEDGSLSRLEEKYFGHGDDFDYVDTRSFLQAVDTLLPELQPLFEKYARHIDWQLLAAIAYQESHWDAQATSPTGVRGLMMLTRETAQSLGLTDRLNAEQSIKGGAQYLHQLMQRLPAGIAESERIWFALAAYNMGYAHMLDARALTLLQKGNPDSWADVKQRLPLLSQKTWYHKTTYGYAAGRQAYTFVENIRKYQISLAGYLREKNRLQLARQQWNPAREASATIAPATPPLPAFSAPAADEKNQIAETSNPLQVPRQ